MDKRTRLRIAKVAGRKGGFKRAAKLSKKRRKEIATGAANARWAKVRDEKEAQRHEIRAKELARIRAEPFSIGDTVMIERRRARLVKPLLGAPGGWLVEPPIQNLRVWYEQDMRKIG